MTKTRLDSLYLMLLGCVVFMLLGGAGAKTSSAAFQDFKVLYYPARCLLQHCDPYDETQVKAVFTANGGDSSNSANMLLFATRYIYLPTAFPLTVPFAILPLSIAQAAWMIVTVMSLILASFLMWDLGASQHPIVAGCLIGYLLANSEVIFILCNAAGLAVSLCVISVWCFQSNRFSVVGVLCLAVSLAVKPQDAFLVWLYYLLAGGIHRRRALQALAVVIIFGLPALLWTWQVSPHWLQEWQRNVATFSAHSGLTDPGPDSANGYGLSMMVNLQPVFATWKDESRFYNLASYLLCAPLFLLWAITALRDSSSRQRQWLALAAAASLTMLPVYHRLNDTKLLLLTVPACAMLWAEGGKLGRLALLLNSAVFLLCSDLLWVAAMGIVAHLHLSTGDAFGGILRAAFVCPTPLGLLTLAIFYTWAYHSSFKKSDVRRNSTAIGRAGAD